MMNGCTITYYRKELYEVNNIIYNYIIVVKPCRYKQCNVVSPTSKVSQVPTFYSSMLS